MTAESHMAAGGADGAAPDAAETGQPGHGHHGDGKLKLAVGAVGVVFGDIGTSPLYAFRETFAGHHSIDADRLHIYG
ncbi:MAG: KUP/HAK/KT family potassium transporter, partial [Sphingopyxis sp.]